MSLPPVDHRRLHHHRQKPQDREDGNGCRSREQAGPCGPVAHALERFEHATTPSAVTRALLARSEKIEMYYLKRLISALRIRGGMIHAGRFSHPHVGTDIVPWHRDTP